MKKPDELMKLAALMKGLTVLGCRPSSPAALAGVQYGDILLSVNGEPTPDWTSFVRARKACGTTMELVLFRDGAEQSRVVDLRQTGGPVDPGALVSELIESRVLQPPSRSDADEPEPS